MNMDYIKPILKKRFTYFGMLVEGTILDALGAHYYKGDRVVWESHRRAGYAMYHRGCSSAEIASRHKVPLRIVNWWKKVWTMYDGAWTVKKYGGPNKNNYRRN